ncbi:MAG: hypothetical protein ACOC97_02025 [Myxococcota bacterium]
MYRWVRRLLATGLGLVAAGAVSIGCTGSNVGDPCTPESVPEGGFEASEAYVETSSVQCRTRVCLWYKLEGDPNKIVGTDSCDDPTSGECVTEEDLDQHAFCTCRCDAPDDVDSPTCSCPSGFTCEELVTVTEAGQGVRGSYCVKDEALDGV